MRHIVLPLLTLLALTAPAQRFQQEYGNPRKPFTEAVATPDHADSHYRTGQPATLRLVAREGGVPLDGTVVRYRTGPDMWLPEQWDSTRFVGGEALVRMGTMTEPGFLACEYAYATAGGTTVRDLVKVAYDPERIKPYTVLPSDFVTFWQQALKEARRVPFEAEYRDISDATDSLFITRLVRLRVGREKWLQGYLTMPRHLSARSGGSGGGAPVVLCPPGAGSQKISPSDYYPRRGCIYLKLEIHDNDQLLPDDDYDRLRRQKCDGYVSRGMASRDTYYYKDVYVGCARAVDFLCSLPEWDGRNVIVTGGSQGGALTIVTAALNERVTLCAPFYPALCDLTGFLHHRAGGWPKFFADQVDAGGGRPSGSYRDGRIDLPQEQAVAVLHYFDVVNFARLLRVPTFMSWGYADDTCSPTSVWAAWNEIKAPKQCDVTPTSGHWRFPASQERLWQWMQRMMR